MPANKNTTRKPWVDPDDAPELPPEFFTHAEITEGGTVVRPATGTLKRGGRPKAENPKVSLNLRLDPDVIEHFRATGPGWQSRINASLRKAAGLG